VAAGSIVSSLTDRERQVLGAMAAGLSNDGIAKQQHLSVKSVESVSRAVFQKLGLGEDSHHENRRVKAVLLYLEHVAESSGAVPIPANEFLGRAPFVSSTHSELNRSRCVTLTGVGGIGKTRVAIELAARHTRDGGRTRFVDLAPCASEGSVKAAFLAAFDAADRQRFDRAVARTAHGNRLLVIIDNAEAAMSFVEDWIRTLLRHPEVTILVTSRAPTGLTSEIVVSVPALSTNDALRLLRARCTEPITDAAAGTLCQAVGCLPLALEMVAARLRSSGPDSLIDQIAKLSGVLEEAGGDGRQVSLSAVFASTVSLLAADEARALRLLSGFPGGFEIDAAAAIIDDRRLVPIISRLADMSLIEFDRVRRYRLLEPVRQLAFEQLVESGELSEFNQRLVQWVVSVASGAASTGATAPGEPSFERLNAERTAIEAALAASLQDGNHADALRIIGRLGWWLASSYPTSWLPFIEKSLASATESDGRAIVGYAQLAAGAVTGTLQQPRCEDFFNAADKNLRAAGHLGAALQARYWMLRWSGGSEEAFASAIALAEQLDIAPLQALLWSARAHHGYLDGRSFIDVEPWFLRAIELGRQSSRPATLSSLQLLAHWLLDLDRPLDEVVPLVDEIEDLVDRITNIGGLGEAELLRGRVLLRQGDQAAARAKFATAIERAEPTESSSALASAILYAAEALDETLTPDALAALRTPAVTFLYQRRGKPHPMVAANDPALATSGATSDHGLFGFQRGAMVGSRSQLGLPA
jgi:predicted ATPase/DNA-binding CsgD family transcriptional regulator